MPLANDIAPAQVREWRTWEVQHEGDIRAAQRFSETINALGSHMAVRKKDGEISYLLYHVYAMPLFGVDVDTLAW